MNNHQAMFWNHEQDKIRCHLCPQNCLIAENQYGICHTRININHELRVINYGEVTALAMDPIEKKPFYHFKPNSKILSVGTFGCNMQCRFCQNHEISQVRAQSDYLSSHDLVQLILKIDDNLGIAFTYNEPFMWYEYMLEVAIELKKQNSDKMFVIVINGYINKEPLQKLLHYVDAMNIDLKAFNSSFYHRLCKASLKPVLETIQLAAQHCHVEVTTLMVTGENDSIKEIEQIAQFLSKIDENIPLHLSRYFPNYKMENQPTDIQKMKEAQLIAKNYLHNVYLGNVPNEGHGI